MGGSKQLARQWGILRLLRDSPEGLTVRELADSFSTSKSTIQRDLETLASEFVIDEIALGTQKRSYRLSEKGKASFAGTGPRPDAEDRGDDPQTVALTRALGEIDGLLGEMAKAFDHAREHIAPALHGRPNILQALADCQSKLVRCRRLFSVLPVGDGRSKSEIVVVEPRPDDTQVVKA